MVKTLYRDDDLVILVDRGVLTIARENLVGETVVYVDVRTMKNALEKLDKEGA